MSPEPLISGSSFVGIRPEFVLRVDGGRPILFPVDYNNTPVYYLEPLEGLVLSLFDGHRTYSVAREMFLSLFPDSTAADFDAVVRSADDIVRTNPSTLGLGSDGLYETSAEPLNDVMAYNPRDFVINTEQLRTRLADPRTRRRLDRPINVYTVFTHHCFTNCLYCYAERPRVAEMPIERWEELLDEMVELGVPLASPDNGDTFARPGGLRFIEMLIERDFHFLLSTKGHLSRADVERLVDAGFTKPVRGRLERHVQLSIDAVDDALSKRLLGTAYSRTSKNGETFQNFLACGIMPRIKAVVTGLNVGELLPLVETYHQLGARKFTFVRYTRTFHRHRDELFVRREHAEVIRRQIDAIHERFPDIELEEDLSSGLSRGMDALSAEEKTAMWSQRIGCGGGWSSLGIAADGSAFLCEQMVLREPFIVGDARTQSLSEIWHGDRLLDFIYPPRERFAGTPCEGCAEFETCVWEQGRCYRDAYFSYGSVYETPPMCPQNQRPGVALV